MRACARMCVRERACACVCVSVCACVWVCADADPFGHLAGHPSPDGPVQVAYYS